MVTPTSRMKLNSANSLYPVTSVYSGSLRNMLSIAPPNVASAHSAKKTTKKAAPSASFARRETGLSGSKSMEAQVDHVLRLGLLVDDPVESEPLHGDLDERRVLLRIVGLARGAVAPGDEGRRFCELLAGLLHYRAHQLEGLRRLSPAHALGLEEAVDHRLHHLRAPIDERGPQSP